MSNQQQQQGNYINFRPSSSSNNNNGGGNNSGYGGSSSAKKQHKYPKRLSQNQEKSKLPGNENVYRPQLVATSSNTPLPSAEQMYNSRTNQDRDTRNKSPIKPLRNFNNWVKGVLIHKYVPTQSTVLDISCGKGGDLFKYHFRNIKNYVGVDIAHSSLADCINRYNENSTQFKFPMSLIHADVGRRSIESALPRGLLFDAVSCQFAAHYMFDAEEHARTLLRNVSERLKIGGKFIVTTSDAYVLVKMLRAAQGVTLKNEVFEATFHCSSDKSFPQPFGNRYDFQLVDAVDRCAEYLVPPKHFIDLAKEHNLSIVEHLNFHDFYQKYGSNQETKVNVKPELKLEGMTEDQWTAIYLYRAFVFEKVGDDTSLVQDYQFNQSLGYRKLSESDIISIK